ncbi:MAG: SEC-C domain-containing protein, partial [Actinomycetia bacterium]|nr:SEC-C domain-containing protein [Actinomycetes bacterium]
MAKRSRRKVEAAEQSPDPDAPSPRQPCPCGSGRRYKNCHGSASASSPFVARPFEGLPGECDWIALREIVPAATAEVSLRADVDTDRSVRVCSLLPMAAPGLVRPDGTIWLGLQVQHNFGDVSRDLAAVIESALDTEPGNTVSAVGDPGLGHRMQDLVDPEGGFDVHVRDGFDFWVDDVEDASGEVAASLQAANDAAAPTARLTGVDAAYWTQMGDRRYLRWVLPHSEDTLLDALARLHAAGDDRLGDGTRLIGSFRAHGVLVPVWELDEG